MWAGTTSQLCSDLTQLGLADRILTLRRHLQRQIVISLTQDHDGVAVDGHGSQFLLLVERLGIIEEIQLADRFFDLGLEIQEALLVELAAAGGMAGAALLHELGEHTDFVAVSPLLGHAVQQVITGGSALPVRDDLLFLQLEVRIGYGEAHELPLVHDSHVFQGVAAQLGEGRGALRILALLADEQLVIAQIQGLAAEVLLQNQRTQHGGGNSSLILFVNVGFNVGALQIQMGLGAMADPSQSLDSFCAAALVVESSGAQGC